MNYNYHTHTTHCGHASGTKREYIETAINGGIKYMGFSDHSPYRFPHGYQAPYRVPMEEAETYINELRALREEYKEQIDLKIGFEMEYFPEYYNEMLSIAKNFGAEYLILGQHFVFIEQYPDGIHCNSAKVADNIDILKEYVNCVIHGINSGVFSYVAHPDMINFTGDDEIFKSEMRKICIASREKNIPIEINFLGIRDKRNYPNELFWLVAGEEKCPVTFGFDAHDTPAACDRTSLSRAMEICEKYGLNYIGKPKIINIQVI